MGANSAAYDSTTYPPPLTTITAYGNPIDEVFDTVQVLMGEEDVRDGVVAARKPQTMPCELNPWISIKLVGRVT